MFYMKPYPPPFPNLNKTELFRLMSYIGENSLTIFMSHLLFYGIHKFVLDNDILNDMSIFHDHHFLLQGVVVLLTFITTILSCKWQTLQLEKVKDLLSKYGSSNK